MTEPVETLVGDPELITRVRAGDRSAFAELYRRHSAAALNLARQYSRNNSAEADDLVSEAFAKVLDGLQSGKGPDTAFRAYLFTTMRHTAYDKTRKDSRLDFTDDDAAIDESVSDPDTVLAQAENTLVGSAYKALPERWQAVLWYVTVEGLSPAETGKLLGLSPNAVTSLAFRAREGLRAAYLQAHLAGTEPDQCRTIASRLGAWTRDGLSQREKQQVDEHLDVCADCRALAAELAEVNSSLRVLLAPILLGGAAIGYLSVLAPVVSLTKVGALVGAAAVGPAAGGAAACGAAAAAGAAGAASTAAASKVGVLAWVTKLPKSTVVGSAAAAVVVVAAVVALVLSGGGDAPGTASNSDLAAASSAAAGSVPAGATGSGVGTGGVNNAAPPSQVAPGDNPATVDGESTDPADPAGTAAPSAPSASVQTSQAGSSAPTAQPTAQSATQPTSAGQNGGAGQNGPTSPNQNGGAGQNAGDGQNSGGGQNAGGGQNGQGNQPGGAGAPPGGGDGPLPLPPGVSPSASTTSNAPRTTPGLTPPPTTVGPTTPRPSPTPTTTPPVSSPPSSPPVTPTSDPPTVPAPQPILSAEVSTGPQINLAAGTVTVGITVKNDGDAASEPAAVTVSDGSDGGALEVRSVTPGGSGLHGRRALAVGETFAADSKTVPSIAAGASLPVTVVLAWSVNNVNLGLITTTLNIGSVTVPLVVDLTSGIGLIRADQPALGAGQNTVELLIRGDLLASAGPETRVVLPVTATDPTNSVQVQLAYLPPAASVSATGEVCRVISSGTELECKIGGPNTGSINLSAMVTRLSPTSTGNVSVTFKFRIRTGLIAFNEGTLTVNVAPIRASFVSVEPVVDSEPVVTEGT